jgi:hypothetical protein
VASPLSPHETPPVPDAESGASSFGHCGNCGAALNGPFCSQCGEKKVSARDYSIGHIVEEAIPEFITFDSRFLRTLKLLFTQPGQLSNAYFRGGRSRYTKPLTLFIIINVLFFFAQPHTGVFGYKYADYMNTRAHLGSVQRHLRQTGEPQQTYMARFDANLQNQKKSSLILAVPVLALFMAILFVGSGRTYAEHLVFSVQVYAFLLAYIAVLALIMLGPVALTLRAVGPAAVPIMRTLEGAYTIAAILIIGLAVYMYAGFRRAYQTHRTRAAVNALILSGAVALLIMLYHNVLFYATFWTT